MNSGIMQDIQEKNDFSDSDEEMTDANAFIGQGDSFK